MNANIPTGLPSPFYRVTTKAIILDDQNRIVVGINDKGEYEMPGGGWEHGESVEACLKREINEELGVEVTNFGPIEWVFTAYNSRRKNHTLRLCMRASVDTYDFKPGDDLAGAHLVTREEFILLPFADIDAPILQFTDQIWMNQ